MTGFVGTDLKLWSKFVLSPALLMGAGTSWLCLATPAVVSAQLLHPTDGPAPSFEVVTIKPADPGETNRSFKISPGYFNARRVTLIDLLKFAYEVKTESQIVAAPDWTSKEFFNIEAKAGVKVADEFRDLPPERKMEPTRLMVQSMLSDRFHLRTSFKSKELAAYALVVAKGGTKLKRETGGPSPADASAVPRSPDMPHAPTLYMTDAHHLTGTNAPMNMLIGWLEHRPELDGRVIVDETGLRGGYDFVLDGVQESSQQASTAPISPDEGVSIFTILREQLGLQLVPRKEPVEVLVIDDVQQPSPN